MNDNILPPLPGSWSALTWQQLCDVWSAKIRYGGNPDVASVAALLTLTLGSRFQVSDFKSDEQTGEHLYLVSSSDGQPETYVITARELAWMAKRALPWFPYPYGDPGKEAVKDEKGKVVKEAIEPHRGYVNENVTDWYDAMMLPKETVIIDGEPEEIKGYDLTPNGIIKYLDLKRPIYEKTACYGHYGEGFDWDN